MLSHVTLDGGAEILASPNAAILNNLGLIWGEKIILDIDCQAAESEIGCAGTNCLCSWSASLGLK